MTIYDPHFDYKVYDESQVEEEYEIPSLDTSLGCLFAGFTSRGRHNKIIECRTRAEIKNEFGDDFTNFKKYGQVNQEAYRVALSGGRVFYCSLLPSDAKTAYYIFGVKVTETNNIPVYQRVDTQLSEDKTSIINYGSGAFILDDNGNKKPVMIKGTTDSEEPDTAASVSGVKLSVESKEISTTDSVDSYSGDIIEVLENLETDPVVEHSKYFPLFILKYYSPGRGGNNFGFIINRDISRDKVAQDGRRYTISFVEQLASGSIKSLYDGETFQFSFNEDATYSSQIHDSEALGNVYNNIDANGDTTKKLLLTPFYNNYKDLLAFISQATTNNVDDIGANVLDIDVLTALNKNGNPYNGIVLDTEGNTIDIENSTNFLYGGTDGSIDPSISGNTPESIANAKRNLLISFFKCDVDDDIFDEKITDIDVLPDANYDNEIKKTILTEMPKYRPDIHLGMDLGITTSAEDAITNMRALSSYVNSEWSYMVSFYGQSGLLNDKQVDVNPNVITATYDWIAGMADNFSSTTGAFQMRAGSGRGRVSYIKPYWIAKKNKKNTIQELEEMSINNIQYLNKQKDMVYMLEDTQYAVDSSKLMSVRNSIVIGRIIRMCAAVLIHYKFSPDDIETTIANAQDALNKNTAMANIPSTIGVTYSIYQTKNDIREDNAHVAIDVTFPNYFKKFHVEIHAHRPETEENEE